jgi:hypothetical protein
MKKKFLHQMKRDALIVFKRSIGDDGRLNPSKYNER